MKSWDLRANLNKLFWLEWIFQFLEISARHHSIMLAMTAFILENQQDILAKNWKINTSWLARDLSPSLLTKFYPVCQSSVWVLKIRSGLIPCSKHTQFTLILILGVQSNMVWDMLNDFVGPSHFMLFRLYKQFQNIRPNVLVVEWVGSTSQNGPITSSFDCVR